MNSQAALAASLIKKELKQAYPLIKFSVKSHNYSGGSSIDVSYTDGPTSDEVDTIISKYQYGSFDGMTDCYNYTNVKDDLPQAQYVHTRRVMSLEVRQKLEAEADKYGELPSWRKQDMVWQLFSRMSIAGAQ